VVQLSSAASSKHVMMSYNWDHQPVIKRIHVALVQRGYTVWIDVEQMKGSTVDAMSRAVEDSAVVLIGVSRAYKESTNCRLEAQYAMQREVDTVPLMLVNGYRPDGWLGMLMGTRMWYAFYGASGLESAVFEGKVEELCRELGERGRGGGEEDSTSAADVTSSVDPVDSELRAELRQLKVAQLQKRAAVVGVGGEAVDSALDAEDVKAALIELIVERPTDASSSAQLLDVLIAGGEMATSIVEARLDDVVELLETQTTRSTPRRMRKSLHEVMQQVELAAEVVDEEWCAGVARCSREDLRCLCELLVGAESLGAEAAASPEAAIASTAALLEGLRRCGSAIVQSLSVLRAEVAQCDVRTRVAAFEVLRSLSIEPQKSVGEDELAAVDVLVRVGYDVERACSERSLAFLALVTLAHRHRKTFVAAGTEINNAFYDDDLTLTFANAAFASTYYFTTCVLPQEECSVFAGRHAGAALFNDILVDLKTLAPARIEQLVSAAKKILQDRDDINLACGALQVMSYMAFLDGATVHLLHRTGVPAAVVELHRHLFPLPLSAEWWASRSFDINVHTWRLARVLLFLQFLPGRHHPDAAGGGLFKEPWWPYVLDVAMQLLKVNESAQLSSRERMSWHPFFCAIQLVEDAAKDTSQHAVLHASKVATALLYATEHDFTAGNYGLASSAAGAAVLLIGRGEEGLVLSRDTVNFVLDRFCECWGMKRSEGSLIEFQPQQQRALLETMFGCDRILNIYASRLPPMAVSDYNLSIMLENEHLLRALVAGLVLGEGHPHRGDAHAAGLQELCAGVLVRLALFAPGRAMLLADADTMAALRQLQSDGTKAARGTAAQALFALEGGAGTSVSKYIPDQTETSAVEAGVGGGKPSRPRWVMLSYSWNHQPIVKRMAAALKARGYSIWIDIESMKGSTVDAMSAAVEDAAVVVICISRAYKESANCRMEAQYALQREVEMVPCMMEEGYRPDGWLGMILGTKLWYGFYGAGASVPVVFGGKVAALCRELGERGRGGDDVAAEEVESPRPA
jgi:hypothetical protein